MWVCCRDLLLQSKDEIKIHMKSILFRISCMLHACTIQGCFHNQVRRSRKERKLDFFSMHWYEFDSLEKHLDWNLNFLVFSIGNWFAITRAFSNVWWKMPWYGWANLPELFNPARNQSLISCLHEKRCVAISWLFFYLFFICQSVYIFIFCMKDGISFTI